MVDGLGGKRTARDGRRGVAYYWPFLAYLIVAGVHLGTLITRDTEGSTVTKLWLMPVLAVCFVVALRVRWSAILVLGTLAILASWAGDALLASPGDLGFLIGLGAFLAAHLIYLAMFLKPLRQRPIPLWAAGYLLWWIILLVVVGPYAGDLLIPVALYGLALAATSIAALGTSRLIAIGALVFLSSDTLLAFKLFVDGWQQYPIDAVIMVLYCGGQLLIAFGAVSLESTIRNRRSGAAQQRESQPG